MRSEGDGSQLYSLPHDTGASAPPGLLLPEAAARAQRHFRTRGLRRGDGISREKPHQRLPVSFPATLLPDDVRGRERRPRTREEKSSASPSSLPPSPKEPEREAAMRARTERFPPQE